MISSVQLIWPSVSLSLQEPSKDFNEAFPHQIYQSTILDFSTFLSTINFATSRSLTIDERKVYHFPISLDLRLGEEARFIVAELSLTKCDPSLHRLILYFSSSLFDVKVFEYHLDTGYLPASMSGFLRCKNPPLIPAISRCSQTYMHLFDFFIDCPTDENITFD